MPGRLEGLTVLVPESRELDLFAGMLEADGARAERCPLVQIFDLEDTSAMDEWISAFESGAFSDLILMTGEGLRRLVARSAKLETKEAFLAALAKVRTITRGPKPARALRELGLAPGIAAPSPTSQGVLDALKGENLNGRRIGVQLYPGHGGDALIAALEARHARVTAVTPYRYASHAEFGVVADAIRRMAAGEVGLIAFTSSPQVERLSEVARECGLEAALTDALKRTRVAAIGPVVEETLKQLGVTRIIRPAAAFHLKPFINAIAEAWNEQQS
jgi:uroporphyrinogen-III synthase